MHIILGLALPQGSEIWSIMLHNRTTAMEEYYSLYKTCLIGVYVAGGGGGTGGGGAWREYKRLIYHQDRYL